MPTDILSTLAPVISWGATYLLHSTCLLGGIWLLLRLRPATGPIGRETLWKFGLVGGLISTPLLLLTNPWSPIAALTLHLPLGSQGGIVTGAPESEGDSADGEFVPDADTEEHDHFGGLVLSDDGAIRRFPSEIEWEVILDDIISVAPTETPKSSTAGAVIASRRPPERSQQSRERVVIAFVAFGFVFFSMGLGRHLRQAVSLRRKLAGAKLVEEGIARTLLDELCRSSSRPPRVRLLIAPHCSEPVAYGLWQGTIVLPARAEHDLSSDELRSLLAHELAHLVRGDTWWLLVSRFICTCVGFQPLNHLARREWQRAAEYLCDAWAVNRTGNRLALARCLTEVASWRLSRSDSAALLAATGNRSVLADRIERLIDDRPIADSVVARWTRRRLTGAALVVLAGLIISGLRVNLSVASGGRATVIEKGNSTGNRVSLQSRGSTASAAVLPSNDGTALAASADRVPPVLLSTDERNVWQSLDSELRVLQRELTELQPLLELAGTPPEAKRLAERLREEQMRLEERRKEMEHALYETLAKGK